MSKPAPWTRTNQTLPPEGSEVIAVTRHHPQDRSQKVSYTYARAVYSKGVFQCAGMVIKCVGKWRLASEDQEILEAQERQVVMFKL